MTSWQRVEYLCITCHLKLHYSEGKFMTPNLSDCNVIEDRSLLIVHLMECGRFMLRFSFEFYYNNEEQCIVEYALEFCLYILSFCCVLLKFSYFCMLYSSGGP